MLPNLVTLDTFTGRQIRRNESAVLHIYLVEKHGEIMLNAAARDGNRNVAIIGQSRLVHGVEGINPDIGGMMVNAQFAITDASILRVHWTRHAGIATPKSVVQYLQMRKNAPLRKLKAKMTVGKGSPGSGIIEGRYDVLTAQKVEDLGYPVTKASYLLSKKEYIGLFDIEVMQPEIKDIKPVPVNTLAPNARIAAKKRARLLTFNQ